MAAKVSKARILVALREAHGVMSATAKLCGIGRTTLMNRISKDPDLKAARDEARESLIDLAETGLVKLLQEADSGAVRWAMGFFGRSRFPEGVTAGGKPPKTAKDVQKLLAKLAVDPSLPAAERARHLALLQASYRDEDAPVAAVHIPGDPFAMVTPDPEPSDGDDPADGGE